VMPAMAALCARVSDPALRRPKVSPSSRKSVAGSLKPPTFPRHFTGPTGPLGPTVDTSMGLNPILNAGESGFRRKSRCEVGRSASSQVAVRGSLTPHPADRRSPGIRGAWHTSCIAIQELVVL
jgi:hypothetical protein